MTDDGTLNSGAYIDDVWPVPLFANHTSINNNITDTLYQMTGRQIGTYWYRVRGFNSLGWSDKGPLEDIRVTGSGIAEQRPARVETRILGVSPNPTSAGVSIRYALASTGRADFRVYDATGTLVRALTASGVEHGASSISWDGNDVTGRQVPAGIYYVRLVPASGLERPVSAVVTIVR
jgi:hypothetical protein